MYQNINLMSDGDVTRQRELGCPPRSTQARSLRLSRIVLRLLAEMAGKAARSTSPVVKSTRFHELLLFRHPAELLSCEAKRRRSAGKLRGPDSKRRWRVGVDRARRVRRPRRGSRDPERRPFARTCRTTRTERLSRAAAHERCPGSASSARRARTRRSTSVADQAHLHQLLEALAVGPAGRTRRGPYSVRRRDDEPYWGSSRKRD